MGGTIIMENKNIIIATTREDLDDYLSTRIGYKIKATDEQWQEVRDQIHLNQIWLGMDEVIHEEFSHLANQLIKTL